jgi:hypothetical protein
MESPDWIVRKSVKRALDSAEAVEEDNVRRMHVQQLRERVRSDRYEVNPEAVAGAVIRRLAEAEEERVVRLRARSLRDRAAAQRI